ncbi:Detected protein of unknown function [Hibiscus syriacus]|uniref:Uncharacterized protein n=1 Tax=Hibiscus syriacus TaxID=106335 RepID=A0A6A2WIZ0_HIBSY|nr:Detected protein of unknown function [Hibiscus syriacus]
MMGCFTVLRSGKKKTEHSDFIKPVAQREHTPTALPEPRVYTRSLQSAPLGFRTRVKPYQVNNETTRDRTHTLSAPLCFDVVGDTTTSSAIRYSYCVGITSMLGVAEFIWFQKWKANCWERKTKGLASPRGQQQGELGVSIPGGTHESPYPRWYDENAHYEYHSGVPGHTIGNCYAFKRIVQKMCDKNWIDFNNSGESK